MRSCPKIPSSSTASAGCASAAATRRARSSTWSAPTARKDAEIAAHLGEVLWSLGRRDEARRIFAEAHTAHPENRLLTDTGRRLGQ